MKRFPHAHEDEVADTAAFGFEYLIGQNELVEDLSLVEIPLEFHGSGGAESASSGAADLAGNAESGAAFFVAEDDGFDELLGASESEDNMGGAVMV